MDVELKANKKKQSVPGSINFPFSFFLFYNHFFVLPSVLFSIVFSGQKMLKLL